MVAQVKKWKNELPFLLYSEVMDWLTPNDFIQLRKDLTFLCSNNTCIYKHEETSLSYCDIMIGRLRDGIFFVFVLFTQQHYNNKISSHLVFFLHINNCLSCMDSLPRSSTGVSSIVLWLLVYMYRENLFNSVLRCN